jgi:hypothetical protein
MAGFEVITYGRFWMTTEVFAVDFSALLRNEKRNLWFTAYAL